MSDEQGDYYTLKLPVAGELYRATAEIAAKRARSVEAVALAALREHVTDAAPFKHETEAER